MRISRSAATASAKSAATGRFCDSCWGNTGRRSRVEMHACLETPSEWVVRRGPLVRGGPLLVVASGSGRHARFFAQRGFEVIAVDRDEQSIPGVRFVKADLEDGGPWPFAGQRFGAIVATNYLHRPLMPLLADAVQRQGVL